MGRPRKTTCRLGIRADSTPSSYHNKAAIAQSVSIECASNPVISSKCDDFGTHKHLACKQLDTKELFQADSTPRKASYSHSNHKSHNRVHVQNKANKLKKKMATMRQPLIILQLRLLIPIMSTFKSFFRIGVHGMNKRSNAVHPACLLPPLQLLTRCLRIERSKHIFRRCGQP